MRTVSFKSVYDGVLQRLGLDPLGDGVSQETARSIARHITNRASNVWTMWDFPELTVTEERAYRAPWYFARQYDQTNEVYYVATETYYRVKAGMHPLLGSIPPADTLNWEVLDPVTPLVARDQPGRNSMGKVVGVYKSDPSLNGCAPHDICLKFRPSEQGIHVCYGPVTTVFVCYTVPVPVYTMVPWIPDKQYVPGSRVFWHGFNYPYPLDYPGFGEVYRCLITTNAQPPSDPLYWTLEPVPDFFSTYLEAGAAADCLKEGPSTADDQGRFTRTAAYDAEADKFIQGVIDDLLAQGQKHYYIKPYWSDGWCLSEPWLGSTVIPLTPEFAPDEPEVPTGSLMRITSFGDTRVTTTGDFRITPSVVTLSI